VHAQIPDDLECDGPNRCTVELRTPDRRNLKHSCSYHDHPAFLKGRFCT
jgi:hypothetical protein